MDIDNRIKQLKLALQESQEKNDYFSYSIKRKELAALYFENHNTIEGIYNLTECHGATLRHIFLKEFAGHTEFNQIYNCVSFDSEYAKNGSCGMLNRLKELPKEWTVVQLCRTYDCRDEKLLFEREPNDPLPLRKFHLVRYPCGTNLETECPVLVDCMWPSNEIDLSVIFWKIKQKLLENRKNAGVKKTNIWIEISRLVKLLCEKIGEFCFKEWLVLFLGSLRCSRLSQRIREQIDNILELRGAEISRRQRCMTYLLAEGVSDISKEYLRSALAELYPEDEAIRTDLFVQIMVIKHKTALQGDLKRNPVILILEDHLDHIPWESVVPFHRHPYSRMPSLHFIHALFKLHCNQIRKGQHLVRITENNLYYCLFENPRKFSSSRHQIMEYHLKQRFPKCHLTREINCGSDDLPNIIKENAIFTYIGHEDGYRHYIEENRKDFQNLSCQLLMSCSSVELKDEGGSKEMFGNSLKFLIGGNSCTLGMLWTVICEDCDTMALLLVNLCLGGEKICANTCQNCICNQSEPEILRGITMVRNRTNLFFSGAALIARGIPVKIIR